MAHSIKCLTIEDEASDALDFLIDNRKEIIYDLKKEYGSRIAQGQTVHNGFKLERFKKHWKVILKMHIRHLYSLNISAETSMLIEDELLIKKWTNKIIKEVLDE